MRDSLFGDLFRLGGAVGFLVAFMSAPTAAAGEPTVGWLQGSSEAYPGYNLFTTLNSTESYLVDNYGRQVHSWSSSGFPGIAIYLLPDGDLLRTGQNGSAFIAGGSGGRIQKLAWDSSLVWDYLYSSIDVQQHHDVAVMPNGNVLILAWERKTPAQAIAAGRDPNTLGSFLWPEHVVEVEPDGLNGGIIVWEWHLWDHLIQDFDPLQSNFGVVADHPERVDINFRMNNGADWIHANSIDYNPQLDQVVISAHHNNELWIIDHSTSSAEAATSSGGNSGQGGDILYRWGNPAAYQVAGEQLLFHQHCVEWVPAGYPGEGNITIFNNGSGAGAPGFSSVIEITPPLLANSSYSWTPGLPFGPTAATWSYTAPEPTDFYSPMISSVRRMANGNTLVCSGVQATFFELNGSGNVVWSYVNPINNDVPVAQGSGPGGSVFRVNRYGVDYPGLAGRALTPGAPLELYPALFDFDGSGVVDSSDFDCFSSLFTGPCTTCEPPIYANALGRLGDGDGDGDIDCDDWLQFEQAWSGSNPPLFTPCELAADFIRGDANQDGVLSLPDALVCLNYLFLGGSVSCESAVDCNDDDSTNITDPLYLLHHLFLAGTELPQPNLVCGPDPTPVSTDCTSFNCP